MYPNKRVKLDVDFFLPMSSVPVFSFADADTIVDSGSEHCSEQVDEMIHSIKKYKNTKKPEYLQNIKNILDAGFIPDTDMADDVTVDEIELYNIIRGSFYQRATGYHSYEEKPDIPGPSFCIEERLGHEVRVSMEMVEILLKLNPAWVWEDDEYENYITFALLSYKVDIAKRLGDYYNRPINTRNVIAGYTMDTMDNIKRKMDSWEWDSPNFLKLQHFVNNL